MTNLKAVLKDGVQFFADGNGKNGLSQRGLAHLIGSPASGAKTDIDRIISKVVDIKNSFESPETITAYTVNGDACQVKLYNSSLCIAVIQYAAFTMGRKEAQFTYAKFAEVGFNTWVEGIVGIKPEATTQPKLSIGEMLILGGEAILREDKVKLALADKPIAKSVHESFHTSTNTLPGFLSIREIGKYFELEFTSETGGALGTAVKGVCFNYNFTTTDNHKHLVTRKGKPVFERCNGYSVEVLEHIPAILKQLGL